MGNNHIENFTLPEQNILQLHLTRFEQLNYCFLLYIVDIVRGGDFDESFDEKNVVKIKMYIWRVCNDHLGANFMSQINDNNNTEQVSIMEHCHLFINKRIFYIF